MEGYLSKGKNAKVILEGIPVYFIKKEVGLDGSKVLARRLSRNLA
jgi:hypothetical protein